jgi:transposase
MARYKHYDLNQTKMIPLSYTDQVVVGSFEYALTEIVEEHLDLTVFEHRYHNDATGQTAYGPNVLLKIVLCGYYCGIVSSRRLAEACRRNVVFMALSADSSRTSPPSRDSSASWSTKSRACSATCCSTRRSSASSARITSPSTAASCRRMLPRSRAAPKEGECPVEALHDGAQHREGGRCGHVVRAQAGASGAS